LRARGVAQDRPQGVHPMSGKGSGREGESCDSPGGVDLLLDGCQDRSYDPLANANRLPRRGWNLPGRGKGGNSSNAVSA
jgi:hypothetical protein